MRSISHKAAIVLNHSPSRSGSAGSRSHYSCVLVVSQPTAPRRRLSRTSVVAPFFRERSNAMETSIDKKRVLALALIACAVLAGPALAQGVSDAQIFINSKDIKWTDAPPSMPKGAKVAVLQGDPGKTGPFVIRLKTPAGYKVAPHWHSQEENLTVLSGTLYLGMGDKLDTKSAHALSAGGFHLLPGKLHHYAFSKVPTVVQINSNGRFDII